MNNAHYNIIGSGDTLKRAFISLKNLRIQCNLLLDDNRIFVTTINSGEFLNMQRVCNAYGLTYEPA